MGVARKAVPDIARAAATLAAGGNPLAGALASTVLQAMLEDQNQAMGQVTTLLESIHADTQALRADTQALRADTQALVQGPYKAGMEYLAQAAQPYRGEEDKRKFVEYAFHNFMSAHGQAQDLFNKALIEYELGNCSILLGNKQDARHWYQRAYCSATNYWADCMFRFVGELTYRESLSVLHHFHLVHKIKGNLNLLGFRI
jgi:hypothetical protein